MMFILLAQFSLTESYYILLYYIEESLDSNKSACRASNRLHHIFILQQMKMKIFNLIVQ